MEQNDPPFLVASNDQLGLVPERADSDPPLCAWCEQSVSAACNSRYDTLTCELRVIVSTEEEWAECASADHLRRAIKAGVERCSAPGAGWL